MGEELPTREVARTTPCTTLHDNKMSNHTRHNPRHASPRTSLVAPLLMLLLGLTACVDEDQYADDPAGNFESLWRIVDEHYCFFEEKEQASGLDWDEVHSRYAKQVNADMTDSQLFEVLANMLSELRDGHVNLYSSFDVARNWSWHESYTANYEDTLERRYLGTDYQIASSLKYRVLDDNIGYVRCASFQSDIGSGNLDEVLIALLTCNGLIIDVRNNTGGTLTTAEKLAARFTNEKVLVGYMRHKTGTGHSDFSDYEEQWLKPGSGVRWQKPVVVLTNRSVFSAANEFVKYMACCPKVTIVGDRTGGGAGLPFSSELPCGWSVRFSACPMYDHNKQSTEDGIDPDHKVDLKPTDVSRGIDTIIEYARQLLRP